MIDKMEDVHVSYVIKKKNLNMFFILQRFNRKHNINTHMFNNEMHFVL